MRCKPGDLCVVIAELPGCEENIGAFVVVVTPPADIGAMPRGVWGFESASRPLRSTQGWYSTTSDCGRWYHALRDDHLLPIRWPEGEKPVPAAEWRQLNEEATA